MLASIPLEFRNAWVSPKDLEAFLLSAPESRAHAKSRTGKLGNRPQDSNMQTGL